MKKIWMLLLLVALLAGCSAKQPIPQEGGVLEADPVITKEPEISNEIPEQREDEVFPEPSDTPATQEMETETSVHASDISPVMYCPTEETGEVLRVPLESDSDLEFFFCIPGGGDYGFWIAPEGSEEWVPFQDHSAGSCIYAKNRNIELTMLKYQFNFGSETNGMYKIRTVRTSSGEVFDEWCNIPILDRTTLIYAYLMDIWLYPGVDGEQMKHTLIVDKMVFCEDCPAEWWELADAAITSDTEDVPLSPEQILLDSELIEFDPGMVYRFEGDGLVFQPKGWNVSLELPEEWKNDVSVFSTHPNGDTLTITVVPNALIEAYMTALDRPAMNSHYDYVVRLICLPKENNPKDWSETAVLLYEDSQIAYYLDTNLSRSPDCQENLIQQQLIDEIGQQKYDTITADYDMTQDEASGLFVFGE